jgi:hypothetical protein
MKKLIMFLLLFPVYYGLCLTATGPAGCNWITSWNANSESDLAGYKVYQESGISILSKDTTFFRFQNVLQTMWFCVSAFDTAGNESKPTEKVWIQILEDTTAPIEPTVVDTIAPNTPTFASLKCEPVVWESQKKTILKDGDSFELAYTVPVNSFWEVDILLGGISGSPYVAYDDSTRTHTITISEQGYVYMKDVHFKKGDHFKFKVSGGDLWIKNIVLIYHWKDQ